MTLKYDLHIHTKYSFDSNLKPITMLRIAKKLGLNGVAITDHNTIKGALEAKKLQRLDKSKTDFEVIVGEEVRTNLGDVLVYYLQEEIKKQDFFDVVDIARQQDAIISLAHPFRKMPLRLGFKGNIKGIAKRINALECLNGRSFAWENKKAEKAANELGLAKTAGSDSHFTFEIGRCRTVFDKRLGLRKAIKNRKTLIESDKILTNLLNTFSNRH